MRYKYKARRQTSKNKQSTEVQAHGKHGVPAELKLRSTKDNILGLPYASLDF